MAMPLTAQAVCGPQVYSDGAQNAIRTERSGSLIVAESNGKYAEPARLGQMFTYSTPAAGVAIPIYSSTTQQCVLWNPIGNTKAFWIRRITLGYVSGTMVAGHYCLAVQTLATNAISGTQSALATNGKLNGNMNANGQNGQSLQLLTAATVVAFTYFRALGLSQVVQAATATNAPWIFSEDVDGSICLLPGSAIAVAANVAAAVTATVAIEGVEAPLALAA